MIELKRSVERYASLMALPAEKRRAAIARQAPTRTPGQFAADRPYYGATAKHAYIYSVRRLTGNGTWSDVLRTGDKARALRVFYGLPKRGRWIVMHDAVTSEQVGQIGRADLHDEIQKILNELRTLPPDAAPERAALKRQGDAMLSICTLGAQLCGYRCGNTYVWGIEE